MPDFCKICLSAGLAAMLALGAVAQVQSLTSGEDRQTAVPDDETVKTEARPATAAARVDAGAISLIMVTDGGQGYIERPPVTISDATGSNAVAVAHVMAGSVVSITVSAPGRHYSAPAITVAPPPPPAVPVHTGDTNAVGAASSEPPQPALSPAPAK